MKLKLFTINFHANRRWSSRSARIDFQWNGPYEGVIKRCVFTMTLDLECFTDVMMWFHICFPKVCFRLHPEILHTQWHRPK